MLQQPSTPLPAQEHRLADKFAAPISAVALGAIALPWLNPAAGGPSAVVQPWLTAAGATLVLWICLAPEVTRRQLALALLVLASMAGVGRAAPPVLLALSGLAVIAICFLIAASSARRRWIVAAIVNAWLLAAVVSSVFALVQYFGLAAHLALWVNSTEPGEAFANLRQRNQFATLTSIGLAAVSWRVQQGGRLAWAVPAAALLAAANAASASRTGAVQIALLVLIAVWWIRTSRRGTGAICIAAVVAYTLAAALLPLALHQLSGVTAPNAFGRLVAADGCASRAALWSNVLHLIAQKPWWGWGWGELDYAHFAALYPGARFCDILDNAHNLPLHLAVELGIPVAAVTCLVFAGWLVRQRPWRETDATRQLAWCVIAVILLHSLLEYPLWYGPFQMAFGCSLGLLAAHRNSSLALAGPIARGALSTALVAALFYTGWDYYRVSQLYTEPEQRSAFYSDRPLPRFGDSWLFRDQLAFAQLSTTPLTRENAAMVHALAMELLHYSPEPRVIDAAIESAMWIGREDQALWLLARLRAAFPQEASSRATATAAPAASDPRVRH